MVQSRGVQRGAPEGHQRGHRLQKSAGSSFFGRIRSASPPQKVLPVSSARFVPSKLHTRFVRPIGLGGQELDLGIRVVWLHQAGGMHLARRAEGARIPPVGIG